MAERLGRGVLPSGPETKTINLALQGGGAHGAFTWGVLDGLLDDGRISVDAISGTSAGAMNAVVLADGLERGGSEAAREQLTHFWAGVSRHGIAASSVDDVIRNMFGFWQPPGFSTYSFFQQFTGLMSPYRMNPLNINPLRKLLESLVDFDRVKHCKSVRLFISATDVRTGRIRVFSGGDVDAAAVMASAALPFLFQAVEIGDNAYWDGGYTGNPALWPFFEQSASDDILLVQVNPTKRDAVPKTPQQIVERVSEITFNNSLVSELRAIDFVNRMISEHRLDPRRYRQNRLHRIEATEALSAFGASTKFDTSWSFFQELRDAGFKAATAWLAEHYDDVGARGTLDLRAAFT
ncbi:MAG: patatin-like phospholipase family protein [Hyphomicrobiales bacterium]|nr:patatin-like phospholipase family protein [Hyphomicrobiales bacterium]